MNDPVSAELMQRAQLPLAWKAPLAIAFGLHLAAGVALLLAPHHRGRPLTLPHVQVRLGQLVPASAPVARGASPVGVSRPAMSPAPVKARPQKTKHTSEPATTHKRAVSPAKPAARTAPVPPPATQQGLAHSSSQTGAPMKTVSQAGADTPAQSGPGTSHGVTIGTAGGDEAPFPFSYYLDRALAMIEGNWYRPPVDGVARCRVLVKLDRSGRVIAAALEEPSSSPAFDRAALRAVWAAAPFPQFPQGFGSTTLTLHLEFGP